MFIFLTRKMRKTVSENKLSLNLFYNFFAQIFEETSEPLSYDGDIVDVLNGINDTGRGNESSFCPLLKRRNELVEGDSLT